MNGQPLSKQNLDYMNSSYAPWTNKCVEYFHETHASYT